MPKTDISRSSNINILFSNMKVNTIWLSVGFSGSGTTKMEKRDTVEE